MSNRGNIFGFNYSLIDYNGAFDIGYTIPELVTYTDELGGDVETERGMGSFGGTDFQALIA